MGYAVTERLLNCKHAFITCTKADPPSEYIRTEDRRTWNEIYWYVLILLKAYEEAAFAFVFHLVCVSLCACLLGLYHGRVTWKFYGKWNWIFSHCALAVFAALFGEVHSVAARLQALELNVLDVKRFSSERQAGDKCSCFLTRRSLFLQDLMSLIHSAAVF